METNQFESFSILDGFHSPNLKKAVTVFHVQTNPCGIPYRHAVGRDSSTSCLPNRNSWSYWLPNSAYHVTCLVAVCGSTFHLLMENCCLIPTTRGAHQKTCSWNPWNLWFHHVLFHEWTNFLISAGSAFYQIWLGREPHFTKFDKGGNRPNHIW